MKMHMRDKGVEADFVVWYNVDIRKALYIGNERFEKKKL